MAEPTTQPESLLDRLDRLRAAGSPSKWQWIAAIKEIWADGEIADLSNLSADQHDLDVANAALIIAAVNAQPVVSEAVRKVLALHTPYRALPELPEICVECDGREYPCPTVQAIAPLTTPEGE